MIASGGLVERISGPLSYQQNNRRLGSAYLVFQASQSIATFPDPGTELHSLVQHMQGLQWLTMLTISAEVGQLPQSAMDCNRLQPHTIPDNARLDFTFFSAGLLVRCSIISHNKIKEFKYIFRYYATIHIFLLSCNPDHKLWKQLQT